jgi:hypothetical protein
MKLVQCYECNGKGIIEYACFDCCGSGLAIISGDLVKCPTCKGRGYSPYHYEVCPLCEGEGVIEEKNEGVCYEISIA